MLRSTLARRMGTTTFRQQLIALKKRHRGASLYQQAQLEAKEAFAQVPTDVTEWVNEENATAAVNGLGFFEIEIPQQGALVDWTRRNVNRFASTKNIVLAAIGLLQLAQGDNREETIQFVQSTIVPRLRAELVSLTAEDFESVVKLFHRARVTDPAVWGDVCAQVMMREKELAEDRVGSIRLFTVLARFAPSNPVTLTLGQSLLNAVAEMEPYDFASFASAVEKLQAEGGIEATQALPRLLRRLSFGNFSARDLAIAFASCVRMFHTLAAGPSKELLGEFNSVFERVKHRVLRHMDPKDPLYWSFPRDLISVAFAYEVNGKHHKDFFSAFRRYVGPFLAELEPHEMAMTLGILRRAHLLDDNVRQLASASVTRLANTGAFNDDELAHVCLCYRFCLHDGPAMSALEQDALKRGTAGTIHAKLILYACFATQGNAVEDFTNVGSRQLLDLVSALPSDHSLRASLENELSSRLPLVERLSNVDLSAVEKASLHRCSHELRRAISLAALARLQNTPWTLASFDLLALVPDADQVKSLPSALSAMDSAVSSGSQFLYVARLLLGLFGPRPEVVAAVKKGAAKLVNEGLREFWSLMSYLELCLAHPELNPGAKWLDFFVYNVFTDKFSSASRDSILTVAKTVGQLPRPVANTFAEAVSLMAARLVELGTTPAEQLEGLRLCNDLQCGADLAAGLSRVRVTELSDPALSALFVQLGGAIPKPAPEGKSETAPASTQPSQGAFVSKFARNPAPPSASRAADVSSRPTESKVSAASSPAVGTPAGGSPAFVSKFAKPQQPAEGGAAKPVLRGATPSDAVKATPKPVARPEPVTEKRLKSTPAKPSKAKPVAAAKPQAKKKGLPSPKPSGPAAKTKKR